MRNGGARAQLLRPIPVGVSVYTAADDSIPDFAAGAMENAGAITFREEELFADPERASLGTRKTVASVVSHEIAHQWLATS